MTSLDTYIQEKKAEFMSHYYDLVPENVYENMEFFIDSLIRQTARETVEDLVPEEFSEGDGWEAIENKRCCPGDDVAEGFNLCRTAILASAKERGIL